MAKNTFFSWARSLALIEMDQWAASKEIGDHTKFASACTMCNKWIHIEETTNNSHLNFHLYSVEKNSMCMNTWHHSISKIAMLHAGEVLLKTESNSSLRWRHNDHDGVSNHQPHGCLLNRLFRRRSKKTSKLRVTGHCARNSPGPVNSPHKGPVMRKMFPFDDVIISAIHTQEP